MSAIPSTQSDYPHILPEDEQRSHAFLNKTPAHGSSIEVYTHPHEYQIRVKLPGFSWDGITLTQKRRVLHIVADRWDNNNSGGDHFERRVAFGSDADLSNVHAQFRNDYLQVSVRRASYLFCHQ